MLTSRQDMSKRGCAFRASSLSYERGILVMATITKRNDKQWQAKVRKKGFSTVSKTFPTKVAAQKWAREIECDMDKGSYVSLSVAETTTLNSIFERYLDEEVPKKKSIADHNSRIKRLNVEFGHLFLIALTPAMVREFRDERLEYVKGDTVRKDISLLGRIIKLAITEWDIHLPRGNPVNSVKLPPKGGSRNRRFVHGEEALLLSQAHKYGGSIESIIKFALETGARRGEIQRLRWENIDLKKSTAFLIDTKNGEDREIPLSSIALNVLLRLPRNLNGRVFDIQADSITKAFRRVCDSASIKDLWFHDLRHEATSRFFEKGLDIMEVSSITGHKDLRMLRNYTHLKAENLVEKINFDSVIG